jgi:hypothetical protein
MNTLFGREPALILAAVSALISLGVGFGLDVSGEQIGLINAAVAAVVGVLVRQNVTPVARENSENGAVQITVLEILVAIIAAVLVLWAMGVVPDRT